MNDHIVLSIYEGHMASSCLMINGKVISAAHEERFSRIKCDVGFPFQAINYCIKYAGIEYSQIDKVVLSNLDFNKNGIANLMFKRPALYSIDDWIYENNNYWRETLINKKNIETYYEIMGGKKRVKDHYYDFSNINFRESQEVCKKKFNEIRKETVSNLLGISKNKVKFLPHYILHHYHAYYSGKNRNVNKTIILHQEGDGGRYNSGISIPTNKGIKWISGNNQSDIGRLYQWVTLILGMKPYHHEYKIMGLAPFSNTYEQAKTYEVFKNIFKLNRKKLLIEYSNKPKDLYFSFKRLLEGHRFDGIAGGLQKYVEDILGDWLNLILKTTKRNNVCYGGGVAMNVKANGILAKNSYVKDFFVPLSPGDETNIFGGAYLSTEKFYLKNNLNPNKLPPLANVYLGPEFSNSEIEKSIIENKKLKNFNIYENISNESIAKILAKGKVLGRFVGKSEYGQRALGNRSIIACTNINEIVNKINSQIKYRDFWMPFCPTIIDSDSKKILDNTKNISSKYMTMSFSVKEKYIKDMLGGIHLGDNTARPQILSKSDNPLFYDLILRLKKYIGIGAVINTSFNLHGEPIVGHPNDAISTLIRSNLDGVILNNFLITRFSIK